MGIKKIESPSIYVQMGKRCRELSDWNKEKNNEVAYQKAGAYDELKKWLEKVRILEEKYYKLRYGNKLTKEIITKTKPPWVNWND